MPTNGPRGSVLLIGKSQLVLDDSVTGVRHGLCGSPPPLTTPLPRLTR
jgi:hypothetical protein